MPDGTTDVRLPSEQIGATNLSTPPTQAEFHLCELKEGNADAIGAIVRCVAFRGTDYAIYRSERGVYVQFSDDPIKRQSQMAAYVKLSVQICELRYLTSQMRPGIIGRFGRHYRQDTLYDHNMGQALMLLMESSSQRTSNHATDADATEKRASDIAQRALDMAVLRNTADNTISYVVTCVLFGIFWLLATLALHLTYADTGRGSYYVLASATGIIGAIFSVIVRAQGLGLKPAADSNMNYLMSFIRVGMGGIAGPVLFLLLMTVSANFLGGSDESKVAVGSTAYIQMVAIIGLIGGFAERLVPTLVQGAADKLESKSGTPGQAVQEVKAERAKN
jgi:hypothetical protein